MGFALGPRLRLGLGLGLGLGFEHQSGTKAPMHLRAIELPAACSAEMLPPSTVPATACDGLSPAQSILRPVAMRMAAKMSSSHEKRSRRAAPARESATRMPRALIIPCERALMWCRSARADCCSSSMKTKRLSPESMPGLGSGVG